MSKVTVCIEQGHIVGIPEADDLSGAARISLAIMSSTDTFDMISGGVLDLALLGMGKTDATGAINVNHLGAVVGLGGFIDIAQNAERLVFCGTFTARGLRLSITDNELMIEQEGDIPKFVGAVRAATLHAASPACRASSVAWVTERAVFELTSAQIQLTEIAPGVPADEITRHMGFAPLIVAPRTMDSELFRD